MSCSSAGRGPAMRCWAVVELLAAVMLFSPAVAVAQRNTTAGAALLEFKAGITNWAAVTKSFQGWTDGTQSTCTWTGVACNANNDVTDLCVPTCPRMAHSCSIRAASHAVSLLRLAE